MSQNNIHESDRHTTDFRQVLREEEAYIEQRRKQVHITEGEAAEGTWGIAFSNGGARASTLMLGVMRKLMSEGVDFFRRIDYLSAVGGSSFMASAFASLLTGKKSTDKFGLFGTRPHNSPFLPETNAAAEGKGVKPDLQMAHFRKRIKDISPQFWKHLGGGIPGLFGIGFAGAFYAFVVLILVMIGFMSLHHIYFYWVSHHSGELFQAFIDNNKTRNIVDWASISNLFDFVGGIAKMVKAVLLASSTQTGLLMGAITTTIGALAGFNFFFMYLSPALRARRQHDVHIEIKVKQFNYFSFALTYFSLFTFAFVAHLAPASINYRLAFALPIFLTFGILISGVIYSFINRVQYPNEDNRRIFISEILLAALRMFIIAIVFPMLLIGLLLIGGWFTLAISIISFLIGIQLVFRRVRQLGNIKAFRRFGNSLPNFFIGFSIVLLFASAGKGILALARTGVGEYQPWWFVLGAVIPAVVLLGFSLFIQKNKDNLHTYFKNIKSKIFLETDSNNRNYTARDDSKLALHGLGADNYNAPYLLLNVTLNVHSSASSNTRRKRGTHFYFSKDYIGSEKTGYVRTEAFHEGKFTLADAMMTTAANYHSGMGIHGFYSQAFLFTLFNLRLGTWMKNPWYYRDENLEHSRGSSRFSNFLREFLNRFSTRALHVNLSSGIHTGDHWGLTALLRRQCENIILYDFRSPGDLIPGELNMVNIRAIAAKYGASIGDIETAPLQMQDKDGRELCQSNVISCALTYESGGKQGRLYYIKLDMSEALSDNLKEYSDKHPRFPFKFRSNLQSPDLQFNSYVNLGENLAMQFYKLYSKNVLNDLNGVIDKRIHQLNVKEEIENLDCEGLKKTERIYIEKLNFFRQEKAITADAAIKFELDKKIEETETDITDIRTEMTQKGCGETEVSNEP